MKTFAICTAVPEDLPALMAFYSDHPHHHVEHRKRIVYQEAVHTGDAIVVKNEAGAICGAALSYCYPNGEYTELGSARIIEPSGFRLHELMTAMRTVDHFLRKPPQREMIADVDEDNPKVLATFLDRLGFLPFTIPTAAESYNLSTVLARTKKIVWLRCPVSALNRHARLLMDAAFQGNRVNHLGETIQLHLQSESPIANHWCSLGILSEIQSHLTCQELAEIGWRDARERLRPLLG